MSSTEVTITKEKLEEDIRLAGIRAGDVVVVHSSLKQIGWVEDGPETVLSALKSVIRPEGTLIMPTFTFNLPMWSLPPYQPWQTESRVGKLTDVFWRQDGVRRTMHPTHSVAAWGRYAARITGGPLDYEPLGIGSPLDRARELGAKILLIGVGQNRNSTVHVAEALARMPYLEVPFAEGGDYDEAWLAEHRGSKPRTIQIRLMPGSSEAFSKLDSLLVEAGIAQPVRIGQAASFIMGSEELCRHVIELLRRDPCFLLTSPDPSEISLRRRRHMEKIGFKKQSI